MPFYLLAPFFASLLFATAAIVVKKAYSAGASSWHALHVINVVVALVFAPLALIERSAVQWELWFQPALLGALFYCGTWMAVVSVRLGDVSLVTPISASKVVVVALAAGMLSGEWPPLGVWAAVAMSALGLIIISAPQREGSTPRATRKAMLSMGGSVVCLGLADVLIQEWAASFGAFTFISLAQALPALLSLVCLKRSSGRIPKCPSPAFRWLTFGGFVAGVQAVLMGLTLAFSQDATGMHVVYSLRGFWSVALAALVGARLGIREATSQSPQLLVRRALGASLLATGAVFIVLLRTP